MCIFVQSVKLYVGGPWKMVVIFRMKPVINLAQMLPLKHKSKQNCMNIWKSVRAWIFPGFLFATAKVASITVLIFFHIILHPTVLIIWFSYIHNFIIILSRVYNEPIQQPAPSWLFSSIGRALHLVSQSSRVRILY